jgi:acetyl esterase/lipase
VEIERVHPELRDAVTRMPDMDYERRILRAVGRIGPRLLRFPATPGVSIGRDRIGGVRVRTYAPERVLTDVELLWIHGGGMVIGAPAMDDALLSETASRFGMRITSVDYRLAPENPFPAPLDDCAAAWRGLVRRAGASARIVVGGQSAGGGLAAALVQRIHDEGGTQPLAQWLFCPMLDDRTAADRSHDDTAHFVWNNRKNRVGWRSLLSIEPGAPTVPPYSVPARREDLTGLPPAWIGVGDIDLFHDEDLAYAERLDDAGVDVAITVVPGAPHGFESVAAQSGPARDFRRAAQDWLGRHVTRAG